MKLSNLLSSLSTVLLISSGLAACATDDPSAKRALFVVSNLGDIPAPGGGERASGVWLSEVTHPYWALRDAVPLQFRSIWPARTAGRPRSTASASS